MNKKTKIAAGTSGAAILLLIFHFWHVAHTVNTIGERIRTIFLKMHRFILYKLILLVKKIR